MCSSMTGYGRAEFSLAAGEGYGAAQGCVVEVKSLNHRYLDINVRMPERFYPLEWRIRERIKKRFSRGSFSVYITYASYAAEALRLNVPAAEAYLDAARVLKERFGVPGEVDVSVLLRLKEVFSSAEAPGASVEDDWKALVAALDEALDALSAMRRREGEALREDMDARLKVLEGLSELIERRVPEAVVRYRERLAREIRALVEGGDVDDARILTEAAVFAERTDVSEELVRFSSHIKQMRRYIGRDEAVGRRLDFLCQELLREVNTIGAKSQDVEITQTVVEIKGELEKIREQVQNIE